MILLHEAYLKAKNEEAKDGLTRLIDCCDYGDSWGFCFVPHIKKEEVNGGAYITVNKKTGDIRYFNPIMDFDLFEKAIRIPIEQFDEYNVAV
jgi:hypothetical protein